MAMRIDVSEVSNAMDHIEEAVREVHERLSIDELMTMATAAAAGRTGMIARCFGRTVHAQLPVQASLVGCCLKISLPLAPSAPREEQSLRWPRTVSEPNASARPLRRQTSFLKNELGFTAMCWLH